jgi:hypothetical protein
VPATGSGIVGGVLEVTIPNQISGKDSGTVTGWVDDKMSTLNLGSFTHTIYVLPLSVKFNGAAAFAYVG